MYSGSRQILAFLLSFKTIPKIGAIFDSSLESASVKVYSETKQNCKKHSDCRIDCVRGTSSRFFSVMSQLHYTFPIFQMTIAKVTLSKRGFFLKRTRKALENVHFAVRTLDARGFQIERFFVYQMCDRLYGLKSLCNYRETHIHLEYPNPCCDL